MTNTTRKPEEVPAEELAKIDAHRLFEEMRDTPSMYGRYADLYVEAERQASLATIRCTAMKAKRQLELRARDKANAVKRTVDEYRALVECDEKYIEAQMEVVKFQARAKSALHRTKAIDKKLEKLRDIATRLNAELRIDPLTLANAKKRGTYSE